MAFAVLIAVVLPTQWSLLTAPKVPASAYSSASSLDRSLGDLDRLSLRWWNFFLPFPENPILGPLGRSTFYAHLGVDTVTEQSTMTGYIALALALVGVFYAFRTRSPASSIPAASLADSDDLEQPGESIGLPTLGQRPGVTRELATLALVCIGAGIIFGLPPQFQFGSLTVPTPPYFVHVVLPEIRTTSRIDLVIQLGVAILAAIGASFLFSKVRSPVRRNVLAGVLALTILLEYINVPPWRYVKLLPAPAVYQWLATLSSQQAGIVAQFPLEASDLPATAIYAFYAYDVHHHPLFNGVLKGTAPDALRRNLLDLLNPTSPASWAALGVKTVTMATGYFEDLYRQGGLSWDGPANGMAGQLPAAYHHAFQDSTTRGYQVTATPAPLLVGLPEHYGDADLRADGRLWQRIGTDNMLWLDNVITHPVQAVLWTLAHNNAGAHAISWPGYAPVPVSTADDSTPLAISLNAAPGMHSTTVHIAGIAPPMPGTGNPTAVTVELRSLEPAPVRSFDARFIEAGTTRWTLSGMSADACTIQAGDTLDVALLWHVNAATLSDQTVFVHLLDGSGKLVAQADGLPDGGTIATSRPGPLLDVSDAHALSLPRTLLPGRYQVQVGLYNATTMVRLQLAAGGDTVNLGSINVIAPSNGPKRMPCSW